MTYCQAYVHNDGLDAPSSSLGVETCSLPIKSDQYVRSNISVKPTRYFLPISRHTCTPFSLLRIWADAVFLVRLKPSKREFTNPRSNLEGRLQPSSVPCIHQAIEETRRSLIYLLRCYPGLGRWRSICMCLRSQFRCQ